MPNCGVLNTDTTSLNLLSGILSTSTSSTPLPALDLGFHQGGGPPDDLGVLQPGVLHYLRSRDPLLRVDLEEPGDEVLGRAGDGVEELRIELVVGGGS